MERLNGHKVTTDPILAQKLLNQVSQAAYFDKSVYVLDVNKQPFLEEMCCLTPPVLITEDHLSFLSAPLTSFLEAQVVLACYLIYMV